MASKSNSILLSCVLAAAVALCLPACNGPMTRSDEQALHERLMATHRAFTQSIPNVPTIQLERQPSDVAQRLEDSGRIEQLDAMAGPTAYLNQPLSLGADLTGQTDSPSLAITLQAAIELAVRNNLDVQLAQIVPAVRQSQITQALAAFDAVYYINGDYSRLDTPGTPGFSGFFADRQSENTSLTTGIRKPLTTGGAIRVETGFTIEDQSPPLAAFNPLFRSNALLGFSQPLLRNFGSDVNKSQIRLAEHAQQSSIQDLRFTLLNTALSTESAYWNLVAARQALLIQLRLLDRTIEDRNRLERRETFDVSPVRITEANSFVELRRAEVIRARSQVRLASDRLKVLIHWEQAPVSSETLLLPVDRPTGEPIRYSLLEAVSTALRHRPEMQTALWNIEDASIRQRVADNQRLPMLNLDVAARVNALSVNDVGDAYGDLPDANYIDYLLSAQFELPIGNRSAEALYQQRILERRASVIAYQSAAQLVVVQVKEALRQLLTSYELIGATQAARRAAADNLRAIEEQEKAGVALTPEFLLDLKLSTQQRLADAESEENQALTDYNIAIANLYRTIGTLLEQNNIEFAPRRTP